MESYTTDILHGAPVVLSNCNLVVLAEWVSQAESLFKVGKTLLGDFKDVRRIYIFKE